MLLAIDAAEFSRAGKRFRLGGIPPARGGIRACRQPDGKATGPPLVNPMNSAAAPPESAIISMRCLAATPGQHYPWHSHSFCEFTFDSDDSATIGYPAGKLAAAPNTLFFIKLARVMPVGAAPGSHPVFGSSTFRRRTPCWPRFPLWPTPIRPAGRGRCGPNRPRHFAGCSCNCSTSARASRRFGLRRRPPGSACSWSPYNAGPRVRTRKC